MESGPARHGDPADGQARRAVRQHHARTRAGLAGRSVADYLVRSLAGFTVSAERPTGAKEVRAQPLASQCGIRNVSLIKGEWNGDFLDELAMFPNGRHDDQVDAASGAFWRLCRYGQQFVPPKFLRIERRPNCVQGDFSGRGGFDTCTGPVRHRRR